MGPETEGSGRRLAAIMFTDVVGYTGITEAGEERAIGVRERHRALLRPLVKQFEGELLETPGDETLSVFPSAVLAVDCAFAMQATLRDDEELKLRIGIHLGDVLQRDGEVIGEGVNLAARIRPLAEPGGVAVSEAVWRQVRGRPHLSADSLGPQKLKNVSDSIIVFALAASASSEVAASSGGRRWGLWIGAGVVLAAATGLLIANSTVVLATVGLWWPKLFSTPIEQQVGMTTTEDGVRIAYATSGEGPPLLSVLGWATHLEDGVNSAVYDLGALLPMTSKRHFFVRYDGRGFGLSDRDVNDFSVEARVRDIEAVVAANGLDQFAIYAQSAGGPAAIAYTARNPERVTRLVLASTMASSLFMKEEQRKTFERTLDIVETNLSTPAVSRLFVDVLLGESVEGGAVARSIFAELLGRSANGPQLAGFMRAQISIDVRDEAAKIRVPTLVMHARDDRTVSLDAGRELAALIPGARFEIVDGGHITGTGNSVATRGRILEFLAEDTPAR